MGRGGWEPSQESRRPPGGARQAARDSGGRHVPGMFGEGGLGPCGRGRRDLFSLEALGRWQEQGPPRMLPLRRGAVCSLEMPLSNSPTGSDGAPRARQGRCKAARPAGARAPRGLCAAGPGPASRDRCLSPGEGTCVPFARPSHLLGRASPSRGDEHVRPAGLVQCWPLGPRAGRARGCARGRGAAGGRVQGRGLHPRCARPARRPHAPGAFAAVNSRRLECQAAAVAETRRPGRGSWWWLRPPCRVPSGRRGPAVTWLPPAGPGSARGTLVGRAPACRRLCRFPGLLLLLAGL